MALGTATGAFELRFDAGRICLDLLATTHPEERFDSVEVLCAWIIGSGLAPPGTPLTHADASWLAGFANCGAVSTSWSAAISPPGAGRRTTGRTTARRTTSRSPA